MTKPTKWHVHPVTTQISLGICPVWSESSLCVHWVAKDPMFLHANSEDFDQTGRIPRLIWVFAGRTDHFVGFIMLPLIWWQLWTGNWTTLVRLRNQTCTFTSTYSSIFAIFISSKIAANEKESYQNFRISIMLQRQNNPKWKKEFFLLYIHFSHTYTYMYNFSNILYVMKKSKKKKKKEDKLTNSWTNFGKWKFVMSICFVKKMFLRDFKWATSSEFVSSSIPSWQTLTAHAQPLKWARELAFCLKVPLDSLPVWASSGGSGETARMRRLAWTFAAGIGDKYQIRLTRSKWKQLLLSIQCCSICNQSW